MSMAGIPTEMVEVVSRKTVYDDLHEPVSEAIDVQEVEAVVAPGATADLDASRPEGATVAYTVHLPKAMAGVRFKGCSVRVRGEELRVVGDPRPYAPEACPGRWCYPVELEAADG